ncbi:hypothetical protein WAZ07_22640 [Bacillus sp. FJAT-51639]|uniref:Uncharacterized protein n=1 Tax=Bacillus bruguierae TaxID=3127667 RepID=A0ABU8FMN9_9BACI
MTMKEKAQLRGFWTHKLTGEHIAITRVIDFSTVYISKVDLLGNELGSKEIMLLRDVKADYVKGKH